MFSFIYAYMSLHGCAPGVFEYLIDKKMMSESTELQLPVVVRHLKWMLGTEISPFERTSSAFN